MERNEKKCSGAISFFFAALSGVVISIKIDAVENQEKVRNTLVGPKCLTDSVSQIKSFMHNFQDNVLSVRKTKKGKKDSQTALITPTKSTQLPLFDKYANRATSNMTEIAKAFFNANIVDHNINKITYLENDVYRSRVIFYPTQNVDYKKSYVDVLTQKPPR